MKYLITQSNIISNQIKIKIKLNQIKIELHQIKSNQN